MLISYSNFGLVMPNIPVKFSPKLRTALRERCVIDHHFVHYRLLTMNETYGGNRTRREKTANNTKMIVNLEKIKRYN